MNGLIKKRFFKYTSIVLVFVFPSVTFAASFDCSKASSSTEKLICSDANVSKLDEKLAISYKQALSVAVEKDAVKKQQREWLKQQRACKDVSCLSQSYQARINELDNSGVHSGNSENSTTSKSSENFKKPLIFKLVHGDSYPICQPYVDMLNAAKYTEHPACERKILPEFSQFKALEWKEIANKDEVLAILKEQIAIQDEMKSRISKYKSYAWESAKKEVEEGHSKLYYALFDFDKDGEKETIYKKVWLYLNAKKWSKCETQNYYYVKDKKITIENAKSLWPGDYSHFNFDGHNDLFFFGDDVFVSGWTTTKLGNYDLSIYNRKISGSVVCGINIK